jgi:hypothetical protein
MNDIFLKRFKAIRQRQLVSDIIQLLALVCLTLVIGFALLTAADWQWELSRAWRVPLHWSIWAMGGLVAVWHGLRLVDRATAEITASKIESAFPELGQAVRTTFEFGTPLAVGKTPSGAAVSLVAALAEDTHRRALPLTIEDVVPVKRVLALVALAGLFALGLAAFILAKWDWQTAASRAMLVEMPYRQLYAAPGSTVVDENGSLSLKIMVVGRTNEPVVFQSRWVEPTVGSWTERTVPVDPTSDPSLQAAALELGLTADNPSNQLPAGNRPYALHRVNYEALAKGFEYRFLVPGAETETYKVGIRRPVRIKEFEVDLLAPAYTRLAAQTLRDGNVTGLAGSQLSFRLTFDKPVRTASIELTPRTSGLIDEGENPAVSLPLQVATSRAGSEFAPCTAEMILDGDRQYTILAEATDGTCLPKNKFRIRVKADQAPQITFEEPVDAVEVHTLAELLMKVRVQDDFGLTSAGIIFQVNNDQEIPLIAEEFQAVAAGIEEADSTGTMSAKTQATLEKLLPLEVFRLTQKDSIMYFAYAVDNLPDSPQRAETEMRFVDIRPLRRRYNVIDPDPMPGQGSGGGDFKSLEELISKQRFGLNRTLTIEKRARQQLFPDSVALDQLMKFETDLAASTRATAEGLESRGFDDTELFYQAEASMLQAVDSLSTGKWENATLQMRDALKFLIEQRDRTIESLLKNPDPARLAALRAFDRMQAQKIRRPKTDKEEAREVVNRLESLSAQQAAVADAVTKTWGPLPVEASPTAESQPTPAGENAPEVSDKPISAEDKGPEPATAPTDASTSPAEPTSSPSESNNSDRGSTAADDAPSSGVAP